MGEYVNSQQIRLDKSAISCGVIQAHHIPKDVSGARFAIVNSMYHKANGRPGAFIIWSDVVRGKKDSSRGELLAEAIREIPKCGRVIETSVAVNPRTGNPIRVWVWEVNHEEVRKWYADEYVNRISEEI